MNRKCEALLLNAVSSTGSYDPDDCMYKIEESLTAAEYKTVSGFLTWCHKNGKSFGSGNLEKVFVEYKKQKQKS